MRWHLLFRVKSILYFKCQRRLFKYPLSTRGSQLAKIPKWDQRGWKSHIVSSNGPSAAGVSCCLLIQVELTQRVSLRWLRQSAKTHKGSDVSGKLHVTLKWWESQQSGFQVTAETTAIEHLPSIDPSIRPSSHPMFIVLWRTSRHLIKSHGHFLVCWEGTSDSIFRTWPVDAPSAVRRVCIIFTSTEL